MTSPIFQFPSAMISGLLTINSREQPDTSVPSTSPDERLKAKTALHRSLVAGACMFELVHGQTAEHEQFS
jgi:hypothetical protein